MTSSRPRGVLFGYVALSLVWLAVLGGALLFTRRPTSEPIEILPPPTVAPTPTSAPSPTVAPTPTPGPVLVDVAGAVLRPGVYRLDRGSIVADAIAIAGGPAPDADLDRLNKAVRLQDGTQVFVPRIGQAAPTQLVPAPAPTAPSATAQAGKPPSGPVNINTATLEQLDALPGIGPALAQRIIDGRPYSRIEDILRVPGIAQATYEKLRALITVQ